MRKVEKDMLTAIREQASRKVSSNTEVVIHRNKHHVAVWADVHLFGNHIARWHYPVESGHYAGPNVADRGARDLPTLTMEPFRCSVTTKSRLNALLNALAAQVGQRAAPGIVQRDWTWYLTIPVGGDNHDPWLKHTLYGDTVMHVAYVPQWGGFRAVESEYPLDFAA